MMFFVVLILSILNMFFPNIEIINYINSKIDIGLIAMIFSAIALFLKLAPQKEVIANIPWNTIIMICGVGMLINVAIEAGTIELLSAFLSENIPSELILIAFSLIAAIMSFFSSTLGVVTPALFPLVPSISAATGINPMAIFVSIVIGAQSSAISPFSSGGSLVLGSISNEEERTKMFQRLLFVGVPVNVVSATVFNFLFSMFTTSAF